MKTLYRMTGEVLVLKFNPEGALSDAKLDKQNVTSELRYVREATCTSELKPFGFFEYVDPKVVEKLKPLKTALKAMKLSFFNAVENSSGSSQFKIWVCEDSKSVLVHKVAKAVLTYDLLEKTFIEAVKVYDLDSTICNKLLESFYVHDS